MSGDQRGQQNHPESRPPNDRRIPRGGCSARWMEEGRGGVRCGGAGSCELCGGGARTLHARMDGVAGGG